MKILFVDDDDWRHNSMAGSCAAKNFDLTQAFTVNQAIDLLKSQRFDWVYLDFDMNDHQYISKDQNGGDVAIFLTTESLSNPPKGVVVHSHNEAGAESMMRTLKNRGFAVHRWEFMPNGNPFCWED